MSLPTSSRQEEPCDFAQVPLSSIFPGELTIEIAQTDAQWEEALAALRREHNLGEGALVGDRLCQLIRQDGKLAAVLIWCASAWHLKDRDEAIGWDPVTRSQRLKLVVGLRRFLILEETRKPNLASQCLGLGLRKLTSQWQEEHGYQPLLAESFSDPESHAGTVYKATNWHAAGLTKGFSAHRTDYYVPNGRPKKLWLKPLHPCAMEWLCARELPEACQRALTDGGGERSALRVPQLSSLRDAFRAVPDPRSPHSRRHPISAMLTLIALGLLMGGANVKDIWRKVVGLNENQRRAIGLKVKKKQSGRLKMPGYDALNDLLAAINPQEFAKVLTTWLQANTGTLPRSLALDGKSIGDGRCGMIITLCDQENGRPVAMTTANGKKDDCEVPAARNLLASNEVNLADTLITADPLHNNTETARVIIEKGGDYLFGTKQNTPVRLQNAEKALQGTPFLN